MHQQTGLFIYKFRVLLAGILAVAFLMLISALVTGIGANTVLNARSHPTADVVGAPAADSPNIVTTGASALSADTQSALLGIGTGLYGVCRTVTNMSAAGGRAAAHGSAVVVGGVWDGTTFVARGVGSVAYHAVHATGTGVMFTLRAPGKVVGSLSNSSGQTVSDIIQAHDTKPVPIISTETSAAALAQLSAAQRQQIAKWQSAQLASNRSLQGTIVAGNENNGGYPASWNDAPQDSRLDSWGMYNRECVSYAAWKVYQTYGHMPYWGGVGNANEWPGDARRAGIPTGSVPKVHSVAIWMFGYYGHAMWVEAVRGNMIYVSQYNYYLNGRYSEMWVNGSNFTYIYFR